MEVSEDHGLPGPIWCAIANPPVALYVSDDLAQFLASLHKREAEGSVQHWLQELTESAQLIWHDRQALARHMLRRCRTEWTLHSWLSALPGKIYLYDLRDLELLRGWPFGVVGPQGRHYRCGRLRLFAVVPAPAALDVAPGTAHAPAVTDASPPVLDLSPAVTTIADGVSTA